MHLTLAPMEGVLDSLLRDILTTFGGIDRCVTEFVRVTDQKLPERIFYRSCPELAAGGTTPSGVPVYLQLLGGNPEMMAANAEKAAALGAPGIDLNFGCPAKLVNRNDGGAALLKDPQRVYAVIAAVRSAVASDTPVTAKIRLGFDDESLLDELVDAVYRGGANELAIHARTRRDGYKPPARWTTLKPLRRHNDIPMIVNGDIRTVEDFNRCRETSGCERVMIGRGVLCRPSLPREIKGSLRGETCGSVAPVSWGELIPVLVRLLDTTVSLYPAKYAGNRVKQWLNYLRQRYLEAEILFERVKRLKKAEEIRIELQCSKGLSPSSGVNLQAAG